MADIGIKTRNVLIYMECDGESSWLKFLGEVWPTQSVYQWLDCLTNPSSEEEVPNINWLISVFSGTKKNYGIPDPDIKSWVQPVKTLMDLLKKSCNLKGSLVFPPYCWPYGVKAFPVSMNIQRVWKDYQGLFHNIYYGGHIETYHHFI